jgi:hypothetical protein
LTTELQQKLVIEDSEDLTVDAKTDREADETINESFDKDSVFDAEDAHTTEKVTVPTAPTLDKILKQPTEEHFIPQHKFKI